MSVLLIGIVVFLVRFNSQQLHPADKLGGVDFIAYWSAFQLAERGGNPYDSDQLLAVQKEISPQIAHPQLYFNPPWMLLVLAPVLYWNFDTSCALWFVLNFVMLVASGIIVGQRRAQLPPLKLLLLTILFVPALETLQLGQLSILILFLFSLVVHLYPKYPRASGFCYALIGIKPQILFLALYAVGVRFLLNRDWKALVSVASVFTSIVFASWLCFPHLYNVWNPFEISPVFYKSATLSTWIRIISEPYWGYITWPVLAMPSLSIIALSLFYIRRGKWFEISFESLSIVLCLSVLFAPYGWIFDQSVLLIVPIILSSRCHWAFRYYMILQVLTYFSRYLISSQHFFIWFPVAIGVPLVVELCFLKKKGSDDSI